MGEREQAGNQNVLLDRAGVAGVDHPAGIGAADAGVVADRGDHVVHVVLGLDQPLARVERLGVGEVLLVPLDDVGQPGQQLAPLALRGVPPGPVVVRPRGPPPPRPRRRSVVPSATVATRSPLAGQRISRVPP